MGAQAHATVDFGAFPGATDTITDVAAVGVVSTSGVEAWLRLAATADHSVDEHRVEEIRVDGYYLSDGNIRISAVCTGPRRLYGQWSVSWVWN